MRAFGFLITSTLFNAHIMMRQGFREKLRLFWSKHQTPLPLSWPANAISLWLSESSKVLLHLISTNVAGNLISSLLCPVSWYERNPVRHHLFQPLPCAVVHTDPRYPVSHRFRDREHFWRAPRSMPIAAFQSFALSALTAEHLLKLLFNRADLCLSSVHLLWKWNKEIIHFKKYF